MYKYISIFWVFIILQYLFLGNLFYENDIFRGKSDDLIIGFTFFLFYFRTKLIKNVSLVYLIFSLFVIIVWLINKYENIFYWFYLLFCWSILLFMRPNLVMNKKRLFIITYVVFLVWYLIIGSAGAKTFNIDVNVLHIFLLMSIIIFCIQGPFRKIFTTILISFLSGTRSILIMSSYSFLRSYFFYIVVLIYICAYLLSLILLDNNPANAARSMLVLNHFINYSQLSFTEILFGAGPQAYLEFDLLINTSIEFVKSKPKTVDSSILRILLEFGVIGTSFLLYFFYKYLSSFKLFILFILTMGLSNEGMLSIYGPLSLLILKSINHNKPNATNFK